MQISNPIFAALSEDHITSFRKPSRDLPTLKWPTAQRDQTHSHQPSPAVSLRRSSLELRKKSRHFTSASHKQGSPPLCILITARFIDLAFDKFGQFSNFFY